jgi:hypothetical protein
MIGNLGTCDDAWSCMMGDGFFQKNLLRGKSLKDIAIRSSTLFVGATKNMYVTSGARGTSILFVTGISLLFLRVAPT